MLFDGSTVEQPVQVSTGGPAFLKRKESNGSEADVSFFYIFGAVLRIRRHSEQFPSVEIK